MTTKANYEAVLKNEFDNMSEHDRFALIFSDPLTKIYNRRAFELQESSAVAIIDVDSLKWVNDNLGHREGDKLLCDVAEALTEAGVVPYRLSGDEFAVRGYSYFLFQAVGGVQKKIGTISVGFGKTLVEADERLRSDKNLREITGKRSSRGVCPPWITLKKEI